ncbi:lactonase family protein [Pontibacter sp. SGAir0037]|uniref:lactonase family protein n=1 Tax=Pontibacter sp. SGAir0037 TaxID=2571030 RepID=UPI0010CD4998|nr:lactonase family protein [Pontibacter sp. SGAir0037]QCR23608.1 6-phosphogluconolactonase [Pontibacter sp. SGAir0037]
MKRMNNHKRFTFVKGTALSLMCAMMIFTACNSSGSEQQESGNETTTVNEAAMVYIGTYAEADSESIFLYSLNPETGELTRVSAAKGGENPSYLALDKDKRFLYAVNETSEYEGQEGGAVSAFAVDSATGNLTLLNRQPTLGGAPCHISLDATNKMVLVANYTGGNVASYQVQENGELSAHVSTNKHSGTGPNKERQEAPHAHFIQPGPDNKYAFSVDLGADQIIGYKLDAAKGAITPNNPAIAYAAKPGSGPRHLAFHPNGRYAYAINELNSTMTALAYNSDNGTFSEIQTITTKPEDFTENNQCAAVKVSADGKFLYGSNRGHNSIVVYAIDESTGNLTLVEHVSTGGDWPRDFTIDLTGNILLVANERSNKVVSFKRNKDTGKLTATGHEVEVSKPVCLKVVE